MLMRLCMEVLRSKGLTGIPYKRPFHQVSLFVLFFVLPKNEIEQYCSDKGIRAKMIHLMTKIFIEEIDFAYNVAFFKRRKS